MTKISNALLLKCGRPDYSTNYPVLVYYKQEYIQDDYSF